MVKPTTITTENAKKENELKKEKEVELPPIVVVTAGEGNGRPTAPPRPQRKCCTPLRCCLVLTVLLVVMAVVAVGGYMLLKHTGNTFKCGVKYEEPHRGGHHGSSSSSDSHEREHDIEEELDINPEEMYERIEQPESDQCERITIMHDYNVNVQLSAYRMWTSGRCYVKKLDPTTTLNPREFWEKMRDPTFFNQHFQTLVETYRVVLPPLDHFGGLGVFIPSLCRDVPTYWLEKVPDELLESWLDEADEIMDMVEDYIEDIMDQADGMMDDDELIFRKRRDIDPAKIYDDVINWTGKNWIDMKVVPPQVTKILQKAGKLDLKLPEKIA